MESVDQFLNDWTHDALGTKPVFLFLIDGIMSKKDIDFEFNARPGISYSLRGISQTQTQRPLFVMIDVIDDDPTQRWLSVCFYGDMINDPEDLGDLIPEGLLGADGYCFDIIDSDEHIKEYVAERIREAYENACNGQQAQKVQT